MPHFEGEVQLHRKGQSCPLRLAQAQLMDQPTESYAYHPLILQDSAVLEALQEHPLPFDDRCSTLGSKFLSLTSLLNWRFASGAGKNRKKSNAAFLYQCVSFNKIFAHVA